VDGAGVSGYHEAGFRVMAHASATRHRLSALAVSPQTIEKAQTLAAVDLGSNSFHMIVVRKDHGEFQVLDRMREMVQLGAGLDARNQLSEEARARALACLERFGQRLRALPRGSVRVVGTNTLRKARKAAGFIREAEQTLGHPIQVISGIEEARLIYLGVSHSLADNVGHRLVVDIGGGSTELIIGERFEPIQLESLYMGCVSMTQQYFADGSIGKSALRAADVAAGLELEGVAETFRGLGWQEAVGASGTAKSIARVVEEQGWSESGITRESLKKLRKALLDGGHAKKLSLKGLTKERAPIFAGGFVVLANTFEALGIEHMAVSEGSLREGVIYDLMGRSEHEDVRERSVNALCQRYHVDLNQAARVERTALAFLQQVAADWGLDDEHHAATLGWAARLHEVGLDIAHSQFQKHGAYVVEHADLLGFSRQEQQVLAALVRGHRRKLPTAVFDALPTGLADSALRLCLLLRLAVKLHRSRTSKPLPELDLAGTEDSLRLSFPEGWLASHPLTAIDLEREQDYLKSVNISAEFA
jgi:exopolyphosphatase/guanosine-5'-triphosphate,3'-diphosphate pyrophosphatase